MGSKQYRTAWLVKKENTTSNRQFDNIMGGGALTSKMVANESWLISNTSYNATTLAWLMALWI